MVWERLTDRERRKAGRGVGRSGTQATYKKVDGSKGTTRGSAEGPIEEEKK